MEKISRILKINFMALLAIPLLLLATFFKLLAKALEKLGIFLALGLLALIITALTKVWPMPHNMGEALLRILIVVGGFAVIFFLVSWLFALTFQVVVMVWNTLISVFNTLYDKTYTRYLSLYASCESDFKVLSINGEKAANAFACIFFTILKGMNWVVVTLISLSYVFAAVISACIVLFSWFDLSGNVKSAFGLSVLQYAKKCEPHAVLSGILLYVAFLAIIILALLTLAAEWHDWGRELRMTSKEITAEVSILSKRELVMGTGTSEQVQKYLSYFKKLEEHANSLPALSGQMLSVLEQKDNPLLRSYWGTYYHNLSPMIKTCSGKKGISIRRFKLLIPQIQLLDKQRENVRKLSATLEKQFHSPSGTSVFFVGCNTLEKLEKRYKSLCKTYHPDAAEGDTATFQQMQSEYETLKLEFKAPQRESSEKETSKKEEGKSSKK